MPLSIRHTVPEDLPLFLGWIATEADMAGWAGEAFHWPLDLDQLRADLGAAARNGRTLWTATNGDGLPVGCASVIVNEDLTIGRFGRVLINPFKRGKGYGRDLVCSTVAAAFRETDVDLLTLGVYTHNQVAQELYRRLGFRETGLAFDVVTDGHEWKVIEMECPREAFRGAADTAGDPVMARE